MLLSQLPQKTTLTLKGVKNHQETRIIVFFPQSKSVKHTGAAWQLFLTSKHARQERSFAALQSFLARALIPIFSSTYSQNLLFGPLMVREICSSGL
jgi:hypothetical protein